MVYIFSLNIDISEQWAFKIVFICILTNWTTKSKCVLFGLVNIIKFVFDMFK